MNKQVRSEHKNNGTTKTRNLISGKLQAIEDAEVTQTARVTVLLRPSERRNIFDRIVFRGSNPDREAKNHNVSRSDILHAIRIETRTRIKEAREHGFIDGRRDSLLQRAQLISIRPEPPSSPSAVAPMRRLAA